VSLRRVPSLALGLESLLSGLCVSVALPQLGVAIEKLDIRDLLPSCQEQISPGLRKRLFVIAIEYTLWILDCYELCNQFDLRLAGTLLQSSRRRC
jgi:hypothetical protein